MLWQTVITASSLPKPTARVLHWNRNISSSPGRLGRSRSGCTARRAGRRCCRAAGRGAGQPGSPGLSWLPPAQCPWEGQGGAVCPRGCSRAGTVCAMPRGTDARSGAHKPGRSALPAVGKTSSHQPTGTRSTNRWSRTFPKSLRRALWSRRNDSLNCQRRSSAHTGVLRRERSAKICASVWRLQQIEPGNCSDLS